MSTASTPRASSGATHLRAAVVARAAVAGYTPGTVAWMKALLQWWRTLKPERPSARRFVHLLRHMGVPAQQLVLNGPGGTERVLVQARLGAGSETTAEWAVIDPDRPHVFTAPDGRMAHPGELRRHPAWVAGNRCDEVDATGHSTPEWTFWARGPRAISFLIGDICNMHCIMCWQDLRRSREPRDKWYREMTAGEIAAIVEGHLESVDTIELVSFGEPMANPQFDEIVSATAELGRRRGRPIELSMITNGSLLHRRRHLDLLKLPGEITFSIDAPDQQIYESIREGADWKDVVDNLRTAVKYPERHAGRKVGINMTVFRPNLESVFAMGAFAAGLGLDYLSVLYGDELEASRAKGMEIDRQDPRLVDQLDRIRRTFPWLQLNDYATPLAVVALPLQPLPGRGFCHLPWQQMEVDSRGRAHPCCRSHGIDLGAAADAWTGEPMTELRRQFLAGDVDPIRFANCATCPSLGIPPSGTKSGVIPLKPI